ncbi:uL15 family ribosomal protein [Candidatus Woesearchaeota archaeon]|nr:uL15 family ribosomal protein [Candidatus Woesearchaeota archaeon]MBW3017433.1 uL15 family ribosomal protein [Candidatus Woesearchaeota archaeon]
MKRRGKKVKKLRGNQTHGYGSKKKHRGAGSRGGRGMAGTGKRADTNKPSINPSTYFGRHGFTSIKKLKQKVKTINIGELSGIEAKSGVIDLTALGYTKLLGKGEVSQKYSVKVKQASKRAVEAIEAKGGSVEVMPKKVFAQPEKEAEPEEAAEESGEEQ